MLLRVNSPGVPDAGAAAFEPNLLELDGWKSILQLDYPETDRFSVLVGGTAIRLSPHRSNQRFGADVAALALTWGLI